MNIIIPSTNLTCDSVNVTYNNNVVPILKSNCYVCHSSAQSTLNGTLDLENYNSLKNYLSIQYHSDGIFGSKFIHIINQTQGVLPMPPTGKLSSCEISIISGWVQEGAKQN